MERRGRLVERPWRWLPRRPTRLPRLG
jgi:hypothetical protein